MASVSFFFLLDRLSGPVIPPRKKGEVKTHFQSGNHCTSSKVRSKTKLLQLTVFNFVFLDDKCHSLRLGNERSGTAQSLCTNQEGGSWPQLLGSNFLTWNGLAMPLLSALASLACSTIARWFSRSLVVAQMLQLSSSSWPCPLAGVASGGILVQQRRRCSFIVESWLNNHGSLEEKRCFSTPLPPNGTWGHRPGVGPVEPAAWAQEKYSKFNRLVKIQWRRRRRGPDFFLDFFLDFFGWFSTHFYSAPALDFYYTQLSSKFNPDQFKVHFNSTQSSIQTNTAQDTSQQKKNNV